MSEELELQRGRDILSVTALPSGKYEAVNVYNDKKPLRFDSLQHMHRFSEKFNYSVVSFRRYRNT